MKFSPSLLIGLQRSILPLLFAVAGWQAVLGQCVQPLQSGTTATLSGIHFSSVANGLAVGNGGRCLLTTDGGANWTPQNARTSRHLYGVFSANANQAWLVGEGGTIRHTTDGGAHWEQQYSPNGSELLDVHFANPAVGLIVGECGVVLRTTDGGHIWQRIVSGTDNTLHRVRFVDATTAIAAGEAGVLLRSTDSGLTWSASGSGCGGDWLALDFDGANGSLGGTCPMGTSADGGNAWANAAGAPSGPVYGLGVLGGKTIVVGENGQVHRLGYEGWANISNPAIGARLRDLSFPDSTVAYAVGDSGRIVKIIFQDVRAQWAGPVCQDATLQLSATGANPGSAFAWSGHPGFGFSNAGQNPLLQPALTAMSGIFSVEASTGGCVATDTVNVLVSPSPDAFATGGSLSCSMPTVDLAVSSSVQGVLYSWTGPGITGANSNLQNPTVNAEGNYTVTVTIPSTGCTATGTSIVDSPGGIPVAAAAAATGFDCATATVALAGESGGVAGCEYTWALPGGGMAVQQNIAANLPGDYILTVRNPLNDCSSKDTLAVGFDFQLPTATAASGTLTCDEPAVPLQGGSNIATATYAWQGPNGFTSNLPNPLSDGSGSYLLTVTNPNNGCSASISTTVDQNLAAPDAFAAGDTITCQTPSVSLNGGSANAGVAFAWTGPNGLNETSSAITVDLPGVYSFVVTDTANGCATAVPVTVAEDGNVPDASAQSHPITCDSATVFLLGNSSSGAVSFAWAGLANGFASSEQNPVVDSPGSYVLTVTDMTNGCAVTDTTTVLTNLQLPQNVTASGDTITCASGQGQLMAFSSTPGVVFIWSSATGFSSNEQNPVVTATGTYMLLVTDPANGCTQTTHAIVVPDANLPDLQATGNAITCSNPMPAIGASSNTDDLDFYWTGPGGFSSTDQNPVVSDAGTYTVTATNPGNGCSSSMQVSVQQADDPPLAEAGSSGLLNCEIGQLILDGSASSQGAAIHYQWTGPGIVAGSDSDSPTVNDAGTYILWVENADNGCNATDSVFVGEDLLPPNLSAAASGGLTCSIASVTLLGSSTTPGALFHWTGNGLDSPLQNPAVSLPGDYTLTITNPLNGCTASSTVSVGENMVPPNLAASVSGEITCANTSVTLQGGSTTPGATFHWTGNGLDSPLEDPTVSVAGTYALMVSNPANGCMASLSVTVEEDLVPPPADIAVSSAVFCIGGSTEFTATGGASYLWSDNLGTSSQVSVTPAMPGSFSYSVTVTGGNGCTATASMGISVGAGVQAAISGQNAFCVGGASLLTATGGGQYLWSNGDTTATSLVSPASPGSYAYAVTVTDTGCTATDELVVEVSAPPMASLAGDTTICPGDTIYLPVYFTGTGPWNLSYNGLEQTGILSNPFLLPVTSLATETVLLEAVSNALCAGTVNGTAEVNVTETAQVSLEVIVCQGDSYLIGGETISEPGLHTIYLPFWNRDCDSLVVQLRFDTLASGQIRAMDDELTFDPSTASTVDLDLLANDSLLEETTVALVSPPNSGTAVIGPDGVLRYTPESGFSGVVELAYVLCQSLCCDTAVVSLKASSGDCFTEAVRSIPKAFYREENGENGIFDPLCSFKDCDTSILCQDADPGKAELTILNRWGEAIFHGNYAPWDGKKNGKPLPEGAYFYHLRISGKTVAKGAINLLQND